MSWTHFPRHALAKRVGDRSYGCTIETSLLPSGARQRDLGKRFPFGLCKHGRLKKRDTCEPVAKVLRLGLGLVATFMFEEVAHHFPYSAQQRSPCSLPTNQVATVLCKFPNQRATWLRSSTTSVLELALNEPSALTTQCIKLGQREGISVPSGLTITTNEGQTMRILRSHGYLTRALAVSALAPIHP